VIFATGNQAISVIRPHKVLLRSVAYPGIFSGGGGSTNSFEDRGQRERGSGDGSTLVRSSAQFTNG
jgi:hypothetical protein